MPPASIHPRASPNPAQRRNCIATPNELATCLAQFARQVRDTIAQALSGDHASPLVRKLRNAQDAARMPEWAQLADTGQLADRFAQILVYGLFIARWSPPTESFQHLTAQVAIPISDPFLRRLVATIPGSECDQEPYAGLLAKLTQFLEATNLDGVFRSLGEQGPGPDPVLHFYETFLAAYNPQLRKARGVYYTPAPVVSFIIRAVDDLLKLRFGVPSGLAEDELPCRVFLFDPACGTGNFLSSLIGHVRNHFLEQDVCASGHASARTWSHYVRRALLPRLHGFEMLAAPYVAAHLHLSRQLAGHDLPVGPLRERCGHEFSSGERLGVHLTNRLEDVAERVEQLLQRLKNQPAAASAESKRHLPILVVVGNPPYRGVSDKDGKWIARLLEDYRQVNGLPLGEKKVWLKNDYVKFMRLGQWCIERAGRGILGFITDHSYLDSPTFRGMRQQLLTAFDEIYVLNLHGNAKRRERAANGSKDENIFDIQQGVAIALFIKTGNQKRVCRVFYEGLCGSRQAKFERLTVSRVPTMRWKRLSPAFPGFELVRVPRTARAEYQKCWPMKAVFAADPGRAIFPLGSNGVQTSRDHLVVGFSKAGLRENLESFLDPHKPDQQVRHDFFGAKSVGPYPPGDTRQWQLGRARSFLRQTPSRYQAITPYVYRPFDQRYLLYHDAMVDWPRPEVMRHLQHANCALCIGRAGLVNSGAWDLVFCVNKLCDHNLFYRGSSVNFPLYLYSNGEHPQRLHANLSPRFIENLARILGLGFVADSPGDLRRTMGPENILHYAYAILHSPAYRRRYAEFLKYDFPRLPLTANVGLFRALCKRGQQLVRLHLLEKRPPTSAAYPIQGDDTIQQVRYLEDACASGNVNPSGRVWINPTQYFEGVPPEAWQFSIGGYPICKKWLKDRKGRQLLHEDQACYGQIVGAITESIRLMHEIDAVIEEYSGWPIRGTKR